MATTLALSREQTIIAVAETTKGTLAPPTTSSQLIIGAGAAEISQQPSFTDSPEIMDTRDIIDRFQDMMPAGDWSFKMLARPSGSKGSVPQGAVPLKSWFGTETITGSTSVAYSPAIEKPSFTLWIKRGHTVFFLTGCTVTKAELEITNKGSVECTLSGQGMKRGWAGRDTLSGAEAEGQTVISVTNPKRFCVGARIWNKTKADDNSDAGYAVTEVDVSGSTITIGTAVPSGGWSSGDTIEGWLPTLTAVGSPIEARDVSVSINSVATSIKSLKITFDDAAKYLDDELTTSGYVEDYAEDVRNISGTIDQRFRQDRLSQFYDAIQGTDTVPIVVTCGTEAGSIMTLSLPYVSLEVPTLTDNAPVIDMTVNFKALGSSGEDSATLTFT